MIVPLKGKEVIVHRKEFLRQVAAKQTEVYEGLALCSFSDLNFHKRVLLGTPLSQTMRI